MVLYQPESGYCYNSDSLFLYDFINKLNPKGSMLDVGAGCGIVGLLCARDNEKIKLDAIEKQELFLNYAKKNADENSIVYQAAKKNIPIYVPGITDGAFGTNLVWFAQDNNFKLNILKLNRFGLGNLLSTRYISKTWDDYQLIRKQSHKENHNG